MWEDYVVGLVGDAAERHNQERIRLQNIRDASNPFELADKKFRKLFRLPRNAAHHLCQTLTDRRLEEGTIPKHIKGSYQASVGDDSFLGMSQPSISRCVNITVNAIVAELAHTSIKFPSTTEEKRKAKRDFLELYGMPDVLGAVDGTHIAIFKPPLNHPTAPGSLFFNRKQFYSINMQMVVDARGRIISINPNFPGSTHDSAVWSMSHLKHTLEREYVNGARKQWILGDRAYPLEPWLMTPVMSPQNAGEENFNSCHTNARNVVEMCFGRIKNKLRCLHRHRTLHYDPPTVSKIIVASCALYNTFCDVLSDSDDDNEDNDDDEDENINDANHNEIDNSDFLSVARRIREAIIRENFS